MKVLIVGQQGQLARQLVACCPADIEYLCSGRLQQPEQVFTSFEPDYVINTAAYTAVDAAETDRDAAFALNVGLVQRLHLLCQASAVPLIQLSTDFVFSGTKNSAYLEQDEATAVNYYGQSKWQAEQYLLTHYAEQSLILRTSWLYSCYGDNFVLKVLKRLNSGEATELRIPPLQRGSPTWAQGLATVIWSLVKQRRQQGLYHWADVGAASRIEFTQAIVHDAYELGLTTQPLPVVPLEMDAGGAAQRPINSALDSGLLRTELTGLRDNADWRSQLRLMLEQYKKLNG